MGRARVSRSSSRGRGATSIDPSGKLHYTHAAASAATKIGMCAKDAVEMKQKLVQLYDFQEEMIGLMEEYWESWYTNTSSRFIDNVPRKVLLNDDDDDDDGNDNGNGGGAAAASCKNPFQCSGGGAGAGENNRSKSILSGVGCSIPLPQVIIKDGKIMKKGSGGGRYGGSGGRTNGGGGGDDDMARIQCNSDTIGSTLEESYTLVQDAILSLEKQPLCSSYTPKTNLLVENALWKGQVVRPDFHITHSWKTWKQCMKFQHPEPGSYGSTYETCHETLEIYRMICSICQKIIWLASSDMVVEDGYSSSSNSDSSLSHGSNAENRNETNSIIADDDTMKQVEEFVSKHNKPKQVSFARGCKAGNNKALGYYDYYNNTNDNTDDEWLRNNINRDNVLLSRKSRNLIDKWRTSSAKTLTSLLPFWAKFRKERNALEDYFEKQYQKKKALHGVGNVLIGGGSGGGSNTKRTQSGGLGSMLFPEISKPCGGRPSRHRRRDGGDTVVSEDNWSGWYNSTMYCN